MMQRFYIGQTPILEPCVQVGWTNYHHLSRLECQCYAAAIIAVHGPPPGFHSPGSRQCMFETLRQEHDFGCYYEVVISFDPDCSEAVSYACRVEEGLTEWNEAGFESPVIHYLDRVDGIRHDTVESAITNAFKRLQSYAIPTEHQKLLIANIKTAWPAIAQHDVWKGS